MVGAGDMSQGPTAAAVAPAPKPGESSGMPRSVLFLFLAICAVTAWWLVRGVPKPVTDAMDEAMWAPCAPRYAAARTAGDSQLVDGYILKPRARFSKAITCGSERDRTGLRPSR
jgi:hypothetical protein